MQVTPHVHQLPVTTPTLFPATTTNVYLVVHAGKAVLIDAGFQHEQTHLLVVEYLESIGSPQVEAILMTHYHHDHSPGATFFAKHFDCPVYAHPLEVQLVEQEIAPVKVTGTLSEGDIVHVGNLALHVLHAPGHTHGCLNFWLPEDSVLFTADNVVGVGTTWIGPPDGDLRVYLDTLRRLKTFRAQWIAPGHGEMIADVEAKIDFFISRRLEREEQVYALLQDRPRTEAELVEAVYRGSVHPSVMWVAERTIQGIVIKLIEDRRVRDEQGTYRAV
ncbi:MBL fold metallo-hydrolase [Tumebacillus permanentifrigoris]|uniref:Glyoxylase-like metal-dependent hydrolase (Beta-lactamase superfamily II) n=1 Tax=Tumebacillus permanentifrigoris TaxID=378543 RepID=A0A316D9E4_9BACL|nr:MBL fold metallo-hydrolase [Tumebacillus permanentifrigoris]PWK08358.1 glyoxylase-like metal-dependent hydrolase (beta-lactamase superfamily II) [Tumebacillus permanentifrigoris]